MSPVACSPELDVTPGTETLPATGGHVFGPVWNGHIQETTDGKIRL